MNNFNYENIVSANTQYNDNIARWRFLYRSFVGGKEYRDAGYLTRYQLESDAEYYARCEETPYDNQVASVINVYNSFLFREPPQRDYGSLQNQPDFESFILDADFDGRSIDAFMREVNTWANVFGHSWIIMSKPNIDAVTRADEIAAGVRPYVSVLTPLVVTDWSWKRTIAGRYELDYFKYVEDVNGDIQTIREWTNEEIRTYVVDTNNEIINDVIVEPNLLGVIPAVICYSQRGITRGIGHSTVGDIADLSRYIYNALSETAQSIRLDSHPSLVVSPDVQVGTGAGAIIQVPDNMDPGLKPYVLDFAGASIDSIMTVINNAAQSIEKIANLGGVRATQSSSMSGVALETEFQLLNARLSTLGDNLELAEEQLWNLYALYQGVENTVVVKYHDSYGMRDSSRDLNELQTMNSMTDEPAIRDMINTRIVEMLDRENKEY